MTEPTTSPVLRIDLRIKPWMIVTVALIAIGAWGGAAAWVLTHDPSEAERASILKQAEAISMMAFGYFLGSSVGSRNKDADTGE